MIGLFQPSLGSESLDLVKKVFLSNWLGRGNMANLFESKIAKYLQLQPNELATNSCCSDSIFAAIRLLNLTENDSVVIPTNSFPAIASAVLEAGANLSIVDISNDGNLSIDAIPDWEINNSCLFFVTHYGGIPFEINELRSKISAKAKIFEDCACALGTFVDGKAVGSNSDFSCWSFDPMKLITCGEGGAYHSNSDSFMELLQKYNYLGLPISTQSGLDKSKDDIIWWTYNLDIPGRRSVFSDFNAAIGIPEINNIDKFLVRKNKIREYYENIFNSIGIEYSLQNKMNVRYSNYFMTIKHDKRDELAYYLKAKGIYTSLRYSPLHKMPIFDEYNKGKFDTANDFYSRSLNIPIHQHLSDSDVDHICEEIIEFNKNN